MKKLSIWTFLLVFIFSAGAFAHYHGHKMHKWWENDEMVKSVGLSEEQLTEIKKIDAGYQDQFTKLRDEIKKLHMEYKDLMHEPKSSDEVITAKYNEMIAKKNEKMSLKLEKKLKMRGVLNPDQVIKLSEIKKEHMMKHKEGKECPYKEGKESVNKESKEGCSYKDKS